MSILTTPVRLDRPLSAAGIKGNLLYTERPYLGLRQRYEVQAWFVLGEAPWLFRSTPERENTIHTVAAAFAVMAGRDVHLRVTSMPRNGNAWAEHFDEDTPDPLPDVEGAGRSWVERVHAGRDVVAGYSDRLVMLGVTLGRARQGDKLPEEMAEALVEITAAVDEGLAGTPATPTDIAWLISRSARMGLSPPISRAWLTELEAADMAALTAESTWVGLATGRTVEVGASAGELEESAHVAVLTCGRVERRNFPEDGRAPWLQFAERLPFEVEVSVRGRIVDGAEGVTRAEKVVDMLQGVKDHYIKDHGETPPAAVERNLAHAKQIQDQVADGTKAEACRLEGVVRWAVYGQDAAEAVRRATVLAKRYGDSQAMWPVHTKGQADALREFTPGEAWDDSGYLRILPLPLWAAGMPTAGVSVGTDHGPILGETVGSTVAHPRLVLHDGHFPMEHLDQSGFMAVVANLGAGKSFLLGSTAYERATRGIPVALLDASPQGPLARLTTLPELAPFSRHLSLGMARAGTLNTYLLVPEPQREAYDNEGEWLDACADAQAERRELTLDALMGVLPYSTARRDGTEEILNLAVVRAPATATSSPWFVVEELERMKEFAGAPPILAEQLTAAAASSARFMFPPRGSQVVALGARRIALTVITTGNLQPPAPGSSPAEWTPAERITIVKLNLAAHLTTAFAYGGDPSARKTAILDEVRFLSYWASGRTLVRKLGFDFRKYDGEAIAAGQDPAHLTDLNVASFLGGMFIGRQTDATVAAAVMRMAGVDGYEQEVLRLRRGEFLYLDCYRRMAKIRVIVRDDRLAAALDTTPRPAAASLELAR